MFDKNQRKRIFLTCPKTISTTTITPIENIAYPTSAHYFPESYRSTSIGLNNPAYALVDALLGETRETWGIDIEVPQDKQGFILGAGNTSFVGMQTPLQKPGGLFDYQLKIPTMAVAPIYAGTLANQLLATGHISCDSSACTSSFKSLMDAWNLIQFYNFERVAVLMVEDQVNSKILEFFGRLGACLSLENLNAGLKPSAFDTHNYGFLLGQGAAFTWLETEDAAIKGGREPIAELISVGIAGEQCNAISQRVDGDGYKRAIIQAYTMGNMEISIAPDLIKTHGTGTKLNNQAERAAINQLFGSSFIATSYKAKIGHTLGASGLLETLMAINEAKQGRISGICNRTEKDSMFLSEDTNMSPRLLLSLGAGMGNIYGASLINVLN